MTTKEYVPKHRVDQLRQRRNEYAVVLNVLNEGSRLHRQLLRMKAYEDVADVIVSDAPSRDGSTELEKMRELGVTAIVTLTEPGRYSASAIAAFAHVLDAGYEGVILMDGNGKDDPEALARFVAAMKAGFAFVQGSRFVPGGRAINTPKSRERLIKFVHAPIVSVLCWHRFTDTTNGYRAVSRALLEDPRVRVFRPIFKGYDIVFYLPWAACHYGFRVTEIPVTREYPADGTVPTHINSWAGYQRMLRPLLMLAMRQF